MIKFIKFIFFKFYILLLLIFLSFINYILYLNNKITNTINECSKNSTIIYSKINNINYYTKKKDLIDILNNNQYIKSNELNKSGKYIIDNDTIKIFKREFNFPNKHESKNIFKIKFNDQKIISIKDINNYNIKNFNIDPKIIGIIYSKNNNRCKLYLYKNKFPKTLIDMIILTEDKNFYIHSGISIKSIIRALFINITKFKIVQGGSTITQQLSKNILLNNKKNIIRKINELIISIIIENKFNKDKIIEMYLNEVFLGQYGNNKIIGFPIASIYYFNKYIDETSIDEQATLVAMLKGASLYNINKNYNLTIKRRNEILYKLKNNNLIDEKLFNFLIKKKTNVNINKFIIKSYPSFIKIIKKEFDSKFSFSINKGYKIFSTLNLNSQNSLNITTSFFNYNFKKKDDDLELIMISIDKLTGEIKSAIGGSNYNNLCSDRIFNKRQIGSLIKPIIYMLILNIPDKFNLNTLVDDKKIIIEQSKNNFWIPKNHDNKFRGKVKLIDSLVNSLNIPYINLGLYIGIDNLINFLKSLELNINNINKFPSIFLGSLYLNPLDVLQIYQIISNKGNLSKLYSIEYIVKNNDLIYDINNYKIIKNVISEQSVYLTLYSMQEVARKGTARRLNIKFNKFNLAAKTGTTNNCIDSWFIGINNNEVFLSWIGKDNYKTSNLTGSSGPLILYEKYLDNIDLEPLFIDKPNDIKYIQIDKDGEFILDEKNYSCNNLFLPLWVYNNIDKESNIFKFLYDSLLNLFK
ncbi:penicillin-binding protein 1B [endosymbiont of Sipalinus gigas]|uniref:transglycosylase domain-containing protein n=1 Tax=endosymbiont of Sipalinus gigas TaxID=1972134 RepID=UPI000DC719E6|nr:transglycosylase domain-containing protein [endosymbiont of Sipalinus gigas]BBA85284.1 penicillin-binding protein 1B [endosymbiont of Sipalinus gigas]